MMMFPRVGRGVFEYVSPMWRKLTPQQVRVREVSYGLKTGRYVAEAAAVMAPFVRRGSLLVPVPNSAGQNSPNRLLAEAISEMVPRTVVADVLGRKRAVESSRKRRMEGRTGLTVLQHGIVLLGRLPSSSPVVFIDNVMTTGTTFEAARRAVGRGRGLAYSQVLDAPMPL